MMKGRGRNPENRHSTELVSAEWRSWGWGIVSWAGTWRGLLEGSEEAEISPHHHPRRQKAWRVSVWKAVLEGRGSWAGSGACPRRMAG